MILNVFILVLVVEIIENKPPSQYWAGGRKPPPPKPPSPWANWDWTAWRPRPPVKGCQVGQRFWCSRDGKDGYYGTKPRVYINDPDYYGPKPMPKFFGPWYPIPPVKCSYAPDPDGPRPVNVLPDPVLPTRLIDPNDPDFPGGPILFGPYVPIPPVKCGPFVPIPPVKCGWPFVPIPPVKTKEEPPIGNPKVPWMGKDIDRDSGCGPEPRPRPDPTRPNWFIGA